MADFERLGGFSYKERRTDKYVFFVGGPFSQWWAEEFVASPFPGYPEEKFNCAEQYMMAAKALLFHDIEVYHAIMRETNPKFHKELGRKVRNFDPAIWNACAKELVFRGNLAKFSQSERLRRYILDTDPLYMVEGAFYDAVWGVKLAFDDPAIDNPGNWRGTNWLGEVLMRVRDCLWLEENKGHKLKDFLPA